jgi:hypothetical protein
MEEFHNSYLVETCRFVERSVYKNRTGSLPASHKLNEVRVRNRLHELISGVALDMSIPATDEGIVREFDPIIRFETGTRVSKFQDVLARSEHTFTAQAEQLYNNRCQQYARELGFADASRYKKQKKTIPIYTGQSLKEHQSRGPKRIASNSALHSLINRGDLAIDEEGSDCADSSDDGDTSKASSAATPSLAVFETSRGSGSALTRAALILHTDTNAAPTIALQGRSGVSNTSTLQRGTPRMPKRKGSGSLASIAETSMPQNDAIAGASVRSRSPLRVPSIPSEEDRIKSPEYWVGKCNPMTIMLGTSVGRDIEWARLCQERLSKAGDAPAVFICSDQV